MSLPGRMSMGLACLAVALFAPPGAGAAAAPSSRTDSYGDRLPPGVVARLGTLRFRHEDLLLSVAFAPDGKRLAAAGRGGAVIVWDLATGKRRRLIRCPGGHASAVAFSPGGKILAYAGGEVGGPQRVYLCDAATGRQLRRLQADSGAVQSLTFSPDGRLITFTRNHSYAVQVFEVRTGKERCCLEGQGWWHEGVAFAPDGNTLASCGQDSVRLWDLATGREVWRFAKGQRVTSLAFTPDGKHLAVARGLASLQLWDVAGRRVVRAFDVLAESSVALSPDGKLLAAAECDHCPRVWELSTGREVLRLPRHSYNVWSVAFSPDGKTLATVDSNAVRLWGVASGRELRPAEGHAGTVYSLALSADGRVLASGDLDNVCLWRPAPGKLLRRFDGDLLGLSADGRTLATTGSRGGFCFRSTPAGREVPLWPPAREFPHQDRFAFSADLKTLVAWHVPSLLDKYSTPPATITVWDVARGKPVRDLEGSREGEVNRLVGLSADGRRVAAVQRLPAHTVRLWRVATGKELPPVVWKRRPRGAGEITCLALSADGALLAAGTEGGLVSFWQTATGHQTGQSRAHRGGVVSLAFSPDDKAVASGGADGTVCVWEAATGRRRSRLAGHGGKVTALAFGLGGRMLASGSEDTTVLVWDLWGTLGGQPGVFDTPPGEADALWAELGIPDADRAFRAARALVAAGDRVVPRWREELRPAVPPDARRVARLLADLGGDDFAAREQAARELGRLGEQAEPALRKALADKPSLELHRRFERLLRPLEYPPPTPSRVRALRAVEVLEQMGTPEARRALRRIVREAPGSWLQREARASLRRLEGRAGAKP